MRLLFMLAALLLAGCTINPQDLASAKPAQQNQTTVAGAGNGTAQAPPPPEVFTMAEVGKHAAKEDCWMVIDGKVLDLTSYVSHPGGDTYVPYCGEDGTQAFNDKGGRNTNHTESAFSMIDDYVIGEIGQPINQTPVGIGPGKTDTEPDQNIPANESANGSSPQPEIPQPPNATTAPAAILTLEEVARHSTATDCWMAIYGKVLNLTVFTSHPGGPAYVPYCGTDATEAFDTKGGRGNAHSSSAAADLAAYTIGELGQPQNRTVDAANVSISGRGEEDEWDDDD